MRRCLGCGVMVAQVLLGSCSLAASACSGVNALSPPPFANIPTLHTPPPSLCTLPSAPTFLRALFLRAPFPHLPAHLHSHCAGSTSFWSQASASAGRPAPSSCRACWGAQRNHPACLAAASMAAAARPAAPRSGSLAATSGRRWRARTTAQSGREKTARRAALWAALPPSHSPTLIRSPPHPVGSWQRPQVAVVTHQNRVLPCIVSYAQPLWPCHSFPIF